MQASAYFESALDTFTNEIYPLCKTFSNICHIGIQLCPLGWREGRMPKAKSCILVQRSERALFHYNSKWQSLKTTAKWKALYRIYEDIFPHTINI